MEKTEKPIPSPESNAAEQNVPHYEVLADPDLRMQYVKLTDELIFTAQQKEIQNMIFLDKSARPVAWLMRALWPLMAEKDEQGNVPPMPDMSFLNIDREQWEPVVGRSEDKEGGIDVGAIPEADIESLREVFRQSEDGESMLSGQNVLVVDEVKVSGDTLRIAEDILKRAFDDAHIEGAHWMIPEIKTKKDGTRYNADLPVWYSDKHMSGRLVADRNPDYSRSRGDDEHPNRVQAAGAMWLSTPFRERPDARGRQLRQEAQMIADEIRAGELPVFPSLEREDFEDRVEAFNGMDAIEFRKLREQAQKTGASVVALYRQTS